MTEKQLIVTFTCSSYVHVYEQKSGIKPVFPYNVHKSIEDAIKFLKEQKNIDEPNVKYYN